MTSNYSTPTEVVNFAKVHPDAIIPSKEDSDAGFDIYACFRQENMIVQPHETAIIPTGISSAFSSNLYAQLQERGSSGSKGIGQRCGVIDSSYRGSWGVPITNHNTKPLLIGKNISKEYAEILSDDYVVYHYEKAICQAVFLPVPKIEIEELTYAELFKIPSKRGTGCLGSSGK